MYDGVCNRMLSIHRPVCLQFLVMKRPRPLALPTSFVHGMSKARFTLLSPVVMRRYGYVVHVNKEK
jgi:hypothetical protein